MLWKCHLGTLSSSRAFERAYVCCVRSRGCDSRIWRVQTSARGCIGRLNWGSVSRGCRPCTRSPEHLGFRSMSYSTYAVSTPRRHCHGGAALVGRANRRAASLRQGVAPDPEPPLGPCDSWSDARCNARRGPAGNSYSPPMSPQCSGLVRLHWTREGCCSVHHSSGGASSSEFQRETTAASPGAAGGTMPACLLSALPAPSRPRSST